MIDMFSLTRGIPEHYNNFFASTDKLLARSNRFVVRRQALEKTSKKNYQNVPSNATIRSDHVLCVRMVHIITPIGKTTMGNLVKNMLELNTMNHGQNGPKSQEKPLYH